MMQHQYWVTKKTVLKKLGTKEDECIVSSDAELDAKLELFRSISDSCLQLQRVLDQYQDRLCVLSQEENSLGKFLKDAGKESDSASKHMVSAGKAISYSGQQRLSIRGPLLRLHHEVETFRGRAVSDMRSTVSAMEKARTEYRAALSWMKSTSAQLDPDTGRGLDNFRKAQRQVRESKKLFDKLTLDVLQKIDLLAAARCNMFSHVLTSYQNSFLTFSTKITDTLNATVEAMNAAPQYEFSVIKELSQNLGEGDEKKDIQENDNKPVDKDQMLFFQDDYKDEVAPEAIKVEEQSESNETQNTPVGHKPLPLDTLIDTSMSGNNVEEHPTMSSDLAGLNLDSGTSSNVRGFMPSQLLEDVNSPLLNCLKPTSSTMSEPSQAMVKPKATPQKEDKAAWFKLFSELDPLANPDGIPGGNFGQSHAA